MHTWNSQLTVSSNMHSWCSRVLGEIPRPLQSLLCSAVELRKHKGSPFHGGKATAMRVGSDTPRGSGTQPGSGRQDSAQGYPNQAGKAGLAGRGRGVREPGGEVCKHLAGKLDRPGRGHLLGPHGLRIRKTGSSPVRLRLTHRASVCSCRASTAHRDFTEHFLYAGTTPVQITEHLLNAFWGLDLCQ